MFVALVRAAVRREFVDAYRKVIVAQSAIMKEEIKGLLEFRVLHPKTQGAPYVNYTAWKSRDDMLSFLSLFSEIKPIPTESKAE